MPKESREGAAVAELIHAIFLANGRLMRAGDTLLRDLGLTGARWQVLGAIKHTSKTVPQIARQYELSRQGVLWIVQSLLKDGLVKYVNNPDHKRAKLLVLTDQGRKTYGEVERRQHNWTSEIGAAFRLEDIQFAAECVRRLGEQIKSSDADDE